MSSDRSSPTSRSRAVAPPRLPPGPLSDLKTLLYRLYLEAGTPSLDTITAHVAKDNSLPGSPSRDTVRRLLHEPALPPSQADAVAVAAVLARLARWDPADAVARVRELWIKAHLHTPLGVPLVEISDPFALDVHRPVALDDAHGLPLLTSYVPRDHDRRVADLVAQAAGGLSAVAILVAGSSAEKTRACWEALTPLRAAGSWRLWHPDPTRPDVLLRDVEFLGPRTVVWLNEAQTYFSTPEGQRVAARLRALLADRDRAPVFVMGTLWPQHHEALTRDKSSSISHLLDGAIIAVPEAFAGHDLTMIKRESTHDARLAWAVANAEKGRITQHVAGGPELLDRFLAAPNSARVLLEAAMDAHRLGHGKALPLSMLSQAAEGYLSDHELNELDDDWLKQALTYVTRPAKGAPGPLARINERGHGRRKHSNGDAASGSSDIPNYRLADYLDQWARTNRSEHVPNAAFWDAVAQRAHPSAYCQIADAAAARDLFRDAAQLYKKAAAVGDARAATSLLGVMQKVSPRDLRPARWVSTRDFRVNVSSMSGLIDLVYRADCDVDSLISQAVNRIPLDNVRAVVRLFEVLREVGANRYGELLALKVAFNAYLGDMLPLGRLFDAMRWGGAQERASVLGRRAATTMPLDEPSVLSMLLAALHGDWAAENRDLLLARNPAAHVRLDDVFGVTMLLSELQPSGPAGNTAQFDQLARRAAAEILLDDGSDVALLLDALKFKFADTAEYRDLLLARDPATHVRLDDPIGLCDLIRAFRDTSEAGQIDRLLARDPATWVGIDDLSRVAHFIFLLQKLGAGEQLDRLVRRVVSHVALNDSRKVGQLLLILHAIEDVNQIDVLLSRDPAVHVHLDNPEAVATLLLRFHKIHADGQLARILFRNPAAQAHLKDPVGVSDLLHALEEVQAFDQVECLLLRNPAAHVSTDDPDAAGILLDTLKGMTVVEQVLTLEERIRSAGRPRFMGSLDIDRAVFPFGHEPDGTASESWSWNDLE